MPLQRYDLSMKYEAFTISEDYPSYLSLYLVRKYVCFIRLYVFSSPPLSSRGSLYKFSYCRQYPSQTKINTDSKCVGHVSMRRKLDRCIFGKYILGPQNIPPDSQNVYVFWKETPTDVKKTLKIFFTSWHIFKTTPIKHR